MNSHVKEQILEIRRLISEDRILYSRGSGAEKNVELPKAVAEAAHPILIVAGIAVLFNLFASALLWVLQTWFPNLSAFWAVLSPILNIFAGLAIQRVIQGILPGGAYLSGLLLGKAAALGGATVSWAQPWIRAAFCASAAILMVAAIDLVIVTVFTFLM